MIYTLLGVLIIILLVYIIWAVQLRKPIKEGMLDYFTVEQYLQEIPTTQGQFVRITPSPTADGRLTISQIQVIDMNGNNIALNRPIYVSGTATGSAPAYATVDGVSTPRIGLGNVWTSARGSYENDFWEVDLGDVHQISQVIYSGEGSAHTLGLTDQYQSSSTKPDTSNPRIRSQGMNCDIMVLVGQEFIIKRTMIFPYEDVTQTITFPNSINITPTLSEPSQGVKNPLLMPLNTPQPEVYLVTGLYKKEELDIICGTLGATVATTGQVSNAKAAGAKWETGAWTLVSGREKKEYMLSNPNESGINSVEVEVNKTAINCFGIKPTNGTASTVAPFNLNRWSQYSDTSVPAYYGTSTMQVPDVNELYNYVKTLQKNSTMPKLNDSISKQIPTLIPECIILEKDAASILGFAVGQYTCGEKIEKMFDVSKIYSVSQLDAEMNNVFNPYGCKQGGRTGQAPKCGVSNPPDSLITNYGSYKNATLYSALENAPWNLILEDGNSNKDQLKGLYSNVQIFGSISTEAQDDMKKSIDLCSKIFLGSEADIGYFLNISYADLKPYMRAETGYRKFCKQEIVQSVQKGSYVFNVVAGNQSSNATNCSTPFTTDMLGLLPGPTRDYVQIWIYNRIIRFLQHKKTSNSLVHQADFDNLGIPGFNINSDMTFIKNSVKKMQPTVYNSPISLDVTNNYILDKIAQAFYEAMGGNYIMSQIYDISTIGGTIIDVRFDMTKHADITKIQAQIAVLKATYHKIRASNVSQDILDEAKSDYETNVAELQSTQSGNTLPPVSGVVGRFFYTYSTQTAAFTITGFTLDSRAVTSFIPELNCGVQVATGGAAGAINYTPTIVYTKNVPEALPCEDSTTLRRIMDDYIDLTQTDLQSVLLGRLNSNGKTYTGPAGAPSMDTTLGTVHVNQIIGAVQVSPTQCAITWTETLWSDASNVPVSDTFTDITRNALFSYKVNTTDWYSNTINIDPSGVIFYETDTVPACVFDTTAWQNTVSPRLDSSNENEIITDFVKNGWNNGMGLICPAEIPNYIFSTEDYCAANPGANASYNNGGYGPLDVAGAKYDYINSGITLRGGTTIRKAQTIDGIDPIVIQQPLPANNILDTLDGTCPATTCEDLNVLYSLVDQYNKDASLPGSILQVTKAYTADPYQCDVEVDINFNVKAENGAGKKVIKGSFTYDKKGKEVPCKENCPVKDLSKIYTTTLALSVSTNLADCSYSLNGSDGRGSGTTIQDNTPLLYKPMDYATFITDINTPDLTTSFDTITSAISDAALNSVSVLTSYRENTVSAVGDIATLGAGCTAKCSDTAVMNNMLAFYKSKVNHTKQINTVLRVGTLNATTCDMTYQEDTLVPLGTGYKIGSSSTAGMRFTLAPDTATCTFKITAMNPILPSSPADYVINQKNYTPSSASCEEVYGIDSSSLTQKTAVDTCDYYRGVVATLKQVTDAATAGANWSVKGVVADVSGVFFPNGTTVKRSEGTTAGANCYGVKPAKGYKNRTGTTDILPFAGNQWNQPGACATTINYVNPGKEAFMNYGTPVQVTESTFPLNTKSFGLDMARNRGGPGLDNLFKEPLRAEATPTELYGPRDIADESLLQPGKSQSYKYIRFRAVKTRDPSNPTVDVGKFRFLTGQVEVDLRFAKVTNPMGSWVGDVGDLVGPGFRRGFSDINKKAIIFAFPYAMLINGFTWTTANPDRGVGGDPVQWKLEGSQNGTFWVTLRDQTRHDYPVPTERYQELPVFRF